MYSFSILPFPLKASGLFAEENSTCQIASMGLDLLRATKNYRFSHLPDIPVLLRFGIHIGFYHIIYILNIYICIEGD